MDIVVRDGRCSSNASAGGVQHARSLPVGRVLVDGQGEQRRIDVFAQVLERTGAGIGSTTGERRSSHASAI